MRFGERCARVELDDRGDGGRARARGRARAGRAEAVQASTASSAERAPDRRVAPARVRLPARPARAGEGRRRGPARASRRVVAALWPARRATRAAYAGPRPAQRPARPGPRRQPLRRLARWLGPRAGTARHRADAAPRATRSSCSPAASRRGPRRSACRRRRRSPTGRGRKASDAAELERGAAERLDIRPRARLHDPRPASRRPRLSAGGRELRRFGSQGQQRLGLLSLLLAERTRWRRRAARLPMLLLDDVLSELDPAPPPALLDLLVDRGARR